MDTGRVMVTGLHVGPGRIMVGVMDTGRFSVVVMGLSGHWSAQCRGNGPEWELVGSVPW